MSIPFLSVILPTYNRKHCVCRMIESVLSQSFKDFELIIIDDGSDDGTKEMLEERYADECIKIVYQKNAGVSSARNLGISLARGKYLTFVDSDDYLLDGFFEDIYQTLSTYSNEVNDVDALIYGGFILKDGILRNVPLFWGDHDYNQGKIAIKKGEDFVKDFCLESGISWGCAKVFKSSLLHQNNIFFDKRIFYGEDMLFALQVYLNSKKIVASHQKFYVYNLGSESLSRGSLNERQKLKNILLTYVYLEGCEEYRSYLALNCMRHAKPWLMKNVFRLDKKTKHLIKEINSHICDAQCKPWEKREVLLMKKNLHLWAIDAKLSPFKQKGRWFYLKLVWTYSKMRWMHPFFSPLLRKTKKMIKKKRIKPNEKNQ